MRDFWIYLAILAGSTYLIRVIPFVAIQEKIKNRFIALQIIQAPWKLQSA